MKEVEIRSIVIDCDSIKQRLLQIGFKNTDNYYQHDIILDQQDANLFKNGSKLRVRMEKGKAELTYKGKLDINLEICERTEINIPVNTANITEVLELFKSIGFPICFQIKKNRDLWIKNDLQVSFDTWPIIGCLMEVEGKEEEIVELVKIVARDYHFRNYRLKEFFQDVIDKTGKNIEELKKEYFNETGFDLGNIELIM